MKTVLVYCQQNEPEKIDLNEFTPFKWDALYVVFGPMLSELIYRDYQITGPENTTNESGVSYYFILNGKVVYIENDNHFKEKIKKGNVLYFHHKTAEKLASYKGSTVSVIILYSDAIMNVNKRVNEENSAYFVYDLSPAQ